MVEDRERTAVMALDTEHEPFESPEALFRHLYEAHHVAEARDLDPETAPVRFWLRRHAELPHGTPERRPPAPDPAAAPPRAPTQSHPAQAPPRATPPPGTRDPLVAAVVAALVRRGHDERAVRRFIHSCAGPAGTPTGEDGLRARFLQPMLDAIAGELTGAWSPAPAAAARQAPPRPPSPPPSPPPPPPAATASDDVMALAEAVQRSRGHHARPARRSFKLDDDAMALADAVQGGGDGGARGRRRSPASRP